MGQPFSHRADPRISVELAMPEDLLDCWDSGTDPKFLSSACVGLYSVGRLPSAVKDPLARVSSGDRILVVNCGVVDLPVPENGMHVGIVYEVWEASEARVPECVFSVGNGQGQDAGFPGWLNAVTFAEQYLVSEVLGDPYGPTPDGRESHT